MRSECEICSENCLDCTCRLYLEPCDPPVTMLYLPLCAPPESLEIKIIGNEKHETFVRPDGYIGIREISNENIDHPAHYKGQKFEVIDVIEDFGLNFSLGNAIKYILRAGKNIDKIEDLKKSIWYIQREIDGHE